LDHHKGMSFTSVSNLSKILFAVFIMIKALKLSLLEAVTKPQQFEK